MVKKKPPVAPNVRRPDAQFRFDARLFSAVAMFKAKMDILYYLNGLCFLPHPNGGAMLAGTDGHQLGLAFDAEGRAPEQRIVSVSSGLIAAARKFKTGTVYIDGDRLALVDAKGVEQFVRPGKCLIEGKFPDVMRALPADPAKLQIGAGAHLNAAYIKRAAEAGQFLVGADKWANAMTSWQEPTANDDQQGGATTVVHRFSSEPNFVVITMPMRVGEPMTAMPQFVADARKPAPQANPTPEAESAHAAPAVEAPKLDPMAAVIEAATKAAVAAAQAMMASKEAA